MRIAIISDIHEDIERLKAAMTVIQKSNIDEIVCLGDIVGFSIPHYKYYQTRNASECIQLIKSNCSIVVAGNHDIYEAKRIPSYNAGFNYPDNWYTIDLEEKIIQAEDKVWLYEQNTLSALISEQEKEYLYHLPEYKIATYGEFKILFSHFLYPNYSGSVIGYAMDEKIAKAHLNYLNEMRCDISISGHAHYEGVYEFSDKLARLHPFGKIRVQKEQGFVGPCIAKGKSLNGFMILDTDLMQLEVIPLEKGKKLNQLVQRIFNSSI